MDEITLSRCNFCGLEFFWPIVTGSEAFYAELSRSEQYYSQERWEFKRVSELIPPTSRVLDVGCGDGVFLSQLAHANKMGLEFNPHAIVKARARGLQVTNESLEDVPGASFDAITLFHVLEHVRAPLPLLKEACRVLRPNGLLIISVPNNDAFVGFDLLHAANAPPHHPLRWREQTFRFLPKILGLTLETLASEPVSDTYELPFRRTQCTRFVSRLLPFKVPLFRPTLGTLVVRRSGNLFAQACSALKLRPRAETQGFALLVVFRKNP